MLLNRNRYDSDALRLQLATQSPQRDGSEWCVSFTASNSANDVDDFVAYLPKAESDHPKMLELLKDFLSHISELDNLVQESCEQEFRRSRFQLSDFKLHIGYLELSDRRVMATYYGTVVNTEWDAEFHLIEPGRWQKVNF